MRLPGGKTVTRHVRRLRSRLGGRALILGYHRVAEDPWDPFSLCVSPANFVEQLEVIRERANPIGLGDLVRGLDHHRIPPRAVVVTFDDGYADALHTAKPLLERAGVPATMFVITGKIGAELWWDELARVVESAPERTLRPAVGAGHASIPATGPAEGFSLDIPGGTFRWRAAASDPAVARDELLQALYPVLRSLSDGDRADALKRVGETLADGSHAEETPIHDTRRCLDADELRELARSDLIELGAHSHTHPDLASRSPVEQRREIEASKGTLEELVSRRVTSFSYPHGSFDPETPRIVKDCGFESACSSAPDLARARSDRFALPRLFVSDVDGGSFAKWLTWWLGR